jgi:hypothetical protein
MIGHIDAEAVNAGVGLRAAAPLPGGGHVKAGTAELRAILGRNFAGRRVPVEAGVGGMPTTPLTTAGAGVGVWAAEQQYGRLARSLSPSLRRGRMLESHRSAQGRCSATTLSRPDAYG